MWALDKSTRLLAGALKHGATLHPQHQTLPGIAADVVSPCFSSFLSTRKKPCSHDPWNNLAVAAFVNGCAHPVLARRAKELGIPDPPARGSTPRETGMMKTAMARLNGHGDVEDGEHGGHDRSDHPLQFFRVLPGSRKVSLGTMEYSYRGQDRATAAILASTTVLVLFIMHAAFS